MSAYLLTSAFPLFPARSPCSLAFLWPFAIDVLRSSWYRLSELLNSLYKNAYMTAARSYLADTLLEALSARNADVFITRLQSLAQLLACLFA